MNFRNHAEEWTRFRKTLLSCLIWWGIGTAIGLLFAIALDDSMQENLAYHLKTGVSYLIENEKTPITYFIRRCLAYAQILLVIWGLEYFTWGAIGMRLLLLSRGFVYGFGQVAWVSAYGLRGLWLGIVAYWPHNLFLIIVAAWIEWMQQGRLTIAPFSLRQMAVCIAGLSAVLGWVEAFGAASLLRYYI